MGQALGTLLNNAIDSSSDERPAVIARMASAAGIEPDTVNQILNGSINCPPMQRISGFARVLNVTVSGMESAMNSDGCAVEMALHEPRGEKTPINCSAYSLLTTGTKFAAIGDAGQLFRKDILRLGNWKTPKEWFDVTAVRMKNILANTARILSKGIDIPVVSQHSDDPEAQVGLLKSVGHDDASQQHIADTIFGDIKFGTSRGVDLAKNAKNVSVMIEKDFIDGEDEHFGEAIAHVAIVQHPVVHGQGEFVAMSLDGKEIPCFTFSKSNQEDPPMLDKVKEAFGITDADFTEEKAISLITEAAGRPTEDKSAELQTANTKIQTLETEVTRLTEDPDKKTVDPDVLDELAEGAEDKLESLVDNGNITPAVAASLKPILIGADGARNSYSLSRKISGGDKSVTKQILEALKENNPVELGIKTGSNSVKLSRSVPDADQSKPDPKDTEARGKKIAAAAGVSELT